MSQWTHVCGCIRVDALRFCGNDDKSNIEKALGHIVKFGDDSYETTMPCGSEGSIEYEIYENPDKSAMAAFTVAVWGDLRDYDDVSEIEKWFNDACSKLWIRNAVLHIEVEYGEEKTITYKQDEQTD